MKASEFDPEVKGGWLLAVAVNAAGVPYNPNSLIGNAFVIDGDYVGNYGAEAIRDFVAYSCWRRTIGGHHLSLRLISSRWKSKAQMMLPVRSIVTVGLQGSLVAMDLKGAGHSGIGQLYNGNEKPFGSFSKFLTEGCRAEAIITATNPARPARTRCPDSFGSGRHDEVELHLWFSGTDDDAHARPSGAASARCTKRGKCATTTTIPVFIPGCGVVE